jgi:hypothetical protein
MPTEIGTPGPRLKQEVFDWIWRGLRTPYIAFAIAVGGVAAGASASLFAEQIRGAFPLAWPGWSWAAWTLNVPAFVFWFAFILATAFVAARQWAVDKARAESTGQLVEALTAMPPASFMVALQTQTQKVLEAYEIGQGQPKNVLAQAVGACLVSLDELARTMFRMPKEVLTGANGMVYWPSVTDAFKSTTRDKIRFLAADADATRLAGILRLEVDLSRSSESEPDAPDQHLKKLVLPVPQDQHVKALVGAETRPRWRVVPGAPLALVDGRVEIVEDVADISQWCSERTALAVDVVDEIRRYFQALEKDHSRSFISIPLRVGEERIGVVNIHASEAGAFGDRDLALQFVGSVAAHVWVLCSLVKAWREAEAELSAHSEA